ncbi:MAG: taurine catabolism dioxygenase TauD [Rhodospirillaceae bacterium]|nr:taurine catabolism dioxygenase TauD [Rhodospirillaceae bacterium]|tara:strand:+ start:28248 stop:29099 length:852 start_codon:yes stop_codon:yes gene_type:complete
MQIEKLTDVVGARITGLDLSQELDAETHGKLHQAWLDHLVLVIPDQDLTQEEQIRFARTWGEFPKRERYKKRAEKDTADKSVMLVSNIRKDGKPIGSLPDGEMMFHTDGAYDEHPYNYTMLYAIELPSTGGNTQFANMYAAYETLSDDLKRKLANCTAHHGYYSGTVQRGAPQGHFNGEYSHPVFIEHNETGRTALFISRLLTLRINELSQEESDEILTFLFDHSEKRDFIYEHEWTVGDLVMWDNRCLNHARTDFPRSERRLLRRNVIQGVRPERGRVDVAA